MPKKKTITQQIDIHTQNACVVAKNNYFVVADISHNESQGLLKGTEVKKLEQPVSRESRQWNGLYWTVLVLCPNNETRRICCDSLEPRRTSTRFELQQVMFKD